jgi:hypothetical protein
MTKSTAVLFILSSLTLAEIAYADDDVKFCSAYDDRIEEVRKTIAEEAAKDSVDFYYLQTRWDRLEHFLELKVSCLEQAVEAYRQTPTEIFDTKCGNN